MASAKIKPMADRVVIEPLEETEEMRGGLYIPDTAKEKPQRGEVEGHDVVLFMKGSPVFPQCGFSASTVSITRSTVSSVMISFATTRWWNRRSCMNRSSSSSDVGSAQCKSSKIRTVGQLMANRSKNLRAASALKRIWRPPFGLLGKAQP